MDALLKHYTQRASLAETDEASITLPAFKASKQQSFQGFTLGAANQGYKELCLHVLVMLKLAANVSSVQLHLRMLFSFSTSLFPDI
eukprot:121434-Amphidinium_carterae.1